MLSRRFILAISLVILLCLAPHGAWIDVDATSGRSDDLDFSGGPNSGQVLSGSYTVRATNVVSMDYIDVEVSDGSAWTPIANITTAPWLTAWDTSVHSDGDYQLRIEGTFTNSTTTG